MCNIHLIGSTATGNSVSGGKFGVNTVYNYYLRAVDGVGHVSSWIGPYVVKTDTIAPQLNTMTIVKKSKPDVHFRFDFSDQGGSGVIPQGGGLDWFISFNSSRAKIKSNACWSASAWSNGWDAWSTLSNTTWSQVRYWRGFRSLF